MINKKMKNLFLCSSLLMITAPILTVISCNNKSNVVNSKILNLKNKLDNFITENKALLNEDCVSPRYANNSNVNLFNCLLSDDVIDNYFDFTKNFSLDDTGRYQLQFEFNYSIKDSYGQNYKPTLSSDKKTITIPVLIWLIDREEDFQVSKFINLFVLFINDDIVQNKENEQYNNLDGKTLSFKNTNFQAIPNEMINKYLDFISLISSRDYKRKPIFEKESANLKQWEGKTFTEVKEIYTFNPPYSYHDSKNKYNYSISNSYFYSKEREYVVFIMKIALDTSSISALINDAVSIYNLSFEKEYSIVVKEWKFKNPSTDDISSYVNKNSELLTTFLNNEVNNNSLLYTPIVNMNPIEANDLGVDSLVENFKNGYSYFLPPSSFDYVFDNGEIRRISFGVDSIDSEGTDVLKININVFIDEGDLKAFDKYSKSFNIKTWEFV